jgi:hypothetical protein
MPTVNDVINQLANAGTVDTSKVGGLSKQIIAMSNSMFSNILLNFEGLSSQLRIPTGGQMNPVLQSGARESLRQALRSNPGQAMTINSAYRTVAQQYLLHQLFLKGVVVLAARPGRSNHEDGLALDIQEHASWKSILENNGWTWQGQRDPVHFSYDIGNDDMGELGVRAFQALWNKYNPQDAITVDGDFGAQTAARMGRSPANGFSPTGLFREGDQGPMITKIRQALINTGADIPLGDVFDDAMVAAVKEFQTRQGLTPDGIVGPKTLSRLDVR